MIWRRSITSMHSKISPSKSSFKIRSNERKMLENHCIKIETISNQDAWTLPQHRNSRTAEYVVGPIVRAVGCLSENDNRTLGQIFNRISDLIYRPIQENPNFYVPKLMANWYPINSELNMISAEVRPARRPAASRCDFELEPTSSSHNWSISKHVATTWPTC